MWHASRSRAVADTLSQSPIALGVEQIATRFNGRGSWKNASR